MALPMRSISANAAGARRRRPTSRAAAAADGVAAGDGAGGAPTPRPVFAASCLGVRPARRVPACVRRRPRAPPPPPPHRPSSRRPQYSARRAPKGALGTFSARHRPHDGHENQGAYMHPPSFPKAEQPTVHLPRPWCGIRGAVTCDIAPVANAIDPRRGPPGAPVAAHAVADRAELLPLRHPPQASGLRALRVPASPRPPLSRSPCNALCGRRRPRAPALPSTDTAAVIVLFPSAPGTSDGTMAAARQLLAVLVAAAALLGVAVAQVRPSVEHPARG